MAESTKLTLSAAFALYDIINRLNLTEEGKERKLPFLISVKLQRNKELLEKDILLFSSRRDEVLKELNASVIDGKISVPVDKQEQYKQEVQNIAKTQVCHNFFKFSIEDLATFSDCYNINSQETALFLACLVEDPEVTGEVDFETPDESAVETVAEKS